VIGSAAPWPRAPATLVLGSGDVHVWRAALDVDESRVHGLRHTLAEDERNRADRFRFERDRARFTVARGLLREILSFYTGVAPADLRFGRGEYGKPFMRPGCRGEPPHFNLSHSNGTVLFAVASDREVGVDVEHVRPGLFAAELPLRYFSPCEVAEISTLARPLRRAAFFRCWTRKEAYLKARGDGLSVPLDQFDVVPLSSPPAVLLGTRDHSREVSRWSVRDLDLGPEFAAAVAVEGESARLDCRTWSPDDRC